MNFGNLVSVLGILTDNREKEDFPSTDSVRPRAEEDGREYGGNAFTDSDVHFPLRGFCLYEVLCVRCCVRTSRSVEVVAHCFVETFLANLDA